MCICLDVLTHHPDGIFDIMVSNPPYISVDEMSGIMSDVREFEPRSALTDGSDGLMFYKRYIQLAPLILVPGGWMIFEVGGGNHSEKVYNLFAHSAFQHCELIKDYNGDDRILKVQYCG
jgi:release factor glutamine methyltransferase